jgi:hypothetical protein
MRHSRGFLVAGVLSLACLPMLRAQQPAQPAPVPAPAPQDVATEESITRALYDVISGPAGGTRNWDRMKSLFLPEARLIPAGRAPDGGYRMRVMTLEDWIAGATPYFAREGFYERELAHRSDAFGQIVHRFSTYESRHAESDSTPFARGINSIQLFNDGKRWWVVNIMWDAERPGLVIPDKYLK